MSEQLNDFNQLSEVIKNTGTQKTVEEVSRQTGLFVELPSHLNLGPLVTIERMVTLRAKQLLGKACLYAMVPKLSSDTLFEHDDVFLYSKLFWDEESNENFSTTRVEYGSWHRFSEWNLDDLKADWADRRAREAEEMVTELPDIMTITFEGSGTNIVRPKDAHPNLQLEYLRSLRAALTPETRYRGATLWSRMPQLKPHLRSINENGFGPGVDVANAMADQAYKSLSEAIEDYPFLTMLSGITNPNAGVTSDYLPELGKLREMATILTRNTTA